MKTRLEYHGGINQQDRMIADKRRSFDRAVEYSYQGARALDSDQSFKALINPNKNKVDYDDKIISIGYESGFECGTVFTWERTNTVWLVYLQDLTELAYFKGDIRRCNYQIRWLGDNEVQSTYAAVRGPVETKINYIQKEGISVDTPNHSLNILLPKTAKTVEYFKRYAKFYLQGLLDTDSKICWRVEGFDTISTPGILEITAVEYYANESEDDIENGIAGSLVLKPTEKPNEIQGDMFIYPRISATYEYTGSESGQWGFDRTLPLEAKIQDKTITLTWIKGYSGQFTLSYGSSSKEIIVESVI